MLEIFLFAVFSVVTINYIRYSVFVKHSILIVSVIFYWDASIAPVNICDSGFIMLVHHVC